ncbi:DUF7507 domain-containing protein [Clostridium ihumii]|uniref:DUF7507 domain-containing protein n=1 Tax=Clostridium ihumii TaxID=1470356 RepID=UPI000687CF2C|nr:SPOCS domain-containing protein [Clostridium ihumii]
MASLVYANPGGNSPSAGGIGWVNFGNFTINPGETITDITATLLDGSTVKFDLTNTAIALGGRSFVATPSPTSGGAAFGNTGYTGINGNVVLYEPNGNFNNRVTELRIFNIKVLDKEGMNIPNYSVILADGETTNLEEGIIYTTNQGVWDLLINMPPVGGGIATTPAISGIGTNIFKEEGTSGYIVSAPVIVTKNATDINVRVISSSIGGGGRQGIAIGFAINKIEVLKNITSRRSPLDQFTLSINGIPNNKVTTTGNSNGIQIETANVFGKVNNTYTIDESMSLESENSLTDYNQTISVINLSNGGQIPPITQLPESVTLQLGDIIKYTITNTPKKADLRIIKTANPNPVVAGNNINYTIVITNQGPDNAQNVILSDTIPSCILNPEYSIDGVLPWKPWPQNGITLGILIYGAKDINVQIRGTVNKSCIENIINTAKIASTTPDPNPDNNTSTTTTKVNTLADIIVKKTGNPNPVIAGDLLTYNIEIMNLGPSNAQEVILEDIVPQCILNPEYLINGILPWKPWLQNKINLGNIEAEAPEINVQIRGNVNSSCIENIENTATAKSTTPDPSPDNNTSKSTTVVDTLADITVKKTASPSPIVSGEMLTYTIVISNLGPSYSQGVKLKDAVILENPEYMLEGSLNWLPWKGSLNLGTLQDNESKVVLIRGIVPKDVTGILQNTATVSSTTKDPNQNNNTDTIGTPINSLADISIKKTVNNSFVNRGNTVVYTLVINNSGPSNAQDVIIEDVVPEEISNVEFSTNGGTDWSVWISPYNIGTLIVNESKTILIRGTITNSALGIVTNTAKVSSTTKDPNPNNNTSSVDIKVVYADLVSSGNLVKSVDKQYADIGEEITYTINVNNTGNTIANNVVISDAIPNGTIYIEGSLVSNVPITGSPSSGINITNGILPNQKIILSYSVKVDKIPVPNPIPNTAYIKYTYTVNPSNPNSVSGSGYTNTVYTKVNHGEILPQNAEKSSDKIVTTPGDIITYTINLKNTGNVSVINTIVNDIVPEGTEFISGTVTINGELEPLQNPNLGINVGSIAPGETITTTFKVKVLQSAPSVLTNDAEINYEYRVNDNLPPIKSKIVTNKVNIPVIKAKLTLVKSSDKVKALVGNTIRYSIKAINAGEVLLQNVIVSDELSSNLNYEGKLTINNIPSNQSILTGVNIGNLEIGEEKIISFDTKVTSIPKSGVITNISISKFNYIVSKNNFNGNSTSNENKINVYNPNFTISKISNKSSVKVGEIFVYTIEIKNTGNIEINNFIIKDDLPLEFQVLSIKLNGVVITGDLKTGIDIGNISIGENKTVEIEVKVISDLNEIFKNIIVGTAKVTVNSETDPNKINKIATDNTGVQVFNPQLTLIKSVDKKYVVVGDIVTYTLFAENTGDITLGDVDVNPITISDILSSSLEFIYGTVTVNGVEDLQSGIISGIDIGVLKPGESVTITFKAKVISNEIVPITNISKAKYGFKLPGENSETGISSSNQVEIYPEIANIDIEKTADEKFVVLKDNITYTLILKNTGTLDAYNVIFKDDLPFEVEVIEGSFSIDGKVINNINIREGVNIGDIKKGDEVIIKYTVKVIKSNCKQQIINKASVKFNYILKENINKLEKSISKSSSTIVDVGISNFKQFSVEKVIQIPLQKPDIEGILNVKGEIEIINKYVVETSNGESNEGQKLGGYKLIVHGVLTEVVEYTALCKSQSVHSAHYNIPFSTFIVLSNYAEDNNVKIEGFIEDIYFNKLDNRNVFINNTVLIKSCLGCCK